MSKEEYTTKYLPQFLKDLDIMLLNQEAKIPVTDYMQIALQLKTCQLLNEIKQELKELRKL